MGLSNEERIHKCFYAANQITNIAKSLVLDYDNFKNHNSRKIIERLKEECLKLLPALFGNKRNPFFWFLGTDEEVGFSKTSLWSLAIGPKIENAITPEAFREREKMLGKEFSKMDRDLFEIKGYLDSELKKVYDIYLWSQQFLYASNRYIDKLAKEYSQANGIIAHILNECFNIFDAEDQYTEAYLKSRIFPLLIGAKKYSSYEEWDSLTKFILANHLQFKFKNFGRDSWDQFLFDKLKVWWGKLETSKNSSKLRFEIWLYLIATELEDNKKLIEFKKIAKGFKIPWVKSYDKLIDKKIQEKKDNSEKKLNRYQEEKDYDKKKILKRETSVINFILNDDEED